MSKNRKSEVEAAQKDIDFNRNKYRVDLDTTMGPLRLELDHAIAPNHCKNMIGLAKIGFYDGLIFHRIVPDFVIQGGCPEGVGTGGPGYQVAAEFNKTKHTTGVLSMARSQDPDSAGSQFFVCLKNVPFLDNQYTAFGRTADDESLKTLAAIGAVETDGRDRPKKNVEIRTAKVVAIPL